MSEADLSRFGERLTRIVSPAARQRMMTKAGVAGKKAALDVAAKKLGGDRKFSGMRGGRGAALGAGYDVGGSEVTVNMRPAGLWKLAQSGRRSSGPIVPRRRSGVRAVLTPMGPRASSTFGPSRGLKALDDTYREAEDEVPKAFAKQFKVEVGNAMRGR